MRFPLITAAVLSVMMAGSPALAEDADPGARIAAYDNAIIGIMKQRLSFAARRDRFEALVGDYYDMPVIASLVVGPKWVSSSEPDRDAAVAALTRHSAIALAHNFTNYGGERFVADAHVTDRGASKVVRVTITAPGSSDTLLYVMRRNGSNWKIIDVISDGVSQLAVQRADMASSVASGGVAGLARSIAKRDAGAH